MFRQPRIEVPKLRKSAKHMRCLLNIAEVCAYRDPDETTVLCHPPSDVNGGSTKSDDFCGVTGCYACHQVIDGHMKKPDGEWMTAEEKEFYWRRGMQRQWRVWWDKGLIKT